MYFFLALTKYIIFYLYVFTSLANASESIVISKRRTVLLPQIFLRPVWFRLYSYLFPDIKI